MSSRINLHHLLEQILGSSNVYYQPPENIKMVYPAIKYSLFDLYNKYADNKAYNQYDSYQIIVIDKNPDNDIYKKISMLPMCTFDRHYKSDNLNHYVFTLFYKKELL